jgi:diguanylate cyclase (GGDEF)-like protein
MNHRETFLLRRLWNERGRWLPPLPAHLADAYRSESTRKFRELAAAAIPFGGFGFLGFALWEASYDLGLLRKTWALRLGLAAFFVVAGFLPRRFPSWAEILYVLAGIVCCMGVLILGTMVPQGRLLAFGGCLMTLSFAFVLSHEIGRVVRSAGVVFATVNVGALTLGYSVRDVCEFDGYLVATSMVLLVASVIQERAQREAFCLDAQLRDLAHTDPLTSLANRRYLEQGLARFLALADRNLTPISLLAIDLDHFKSVNDTHGHAVGDAILKGVAQILSGELRATDLFARTGGEEFVAVLPLAPLEGGRVVAERLRKRIEGALFPSGTATVRITMSVGLAERRPGEGGTDLLRRADEALYRAKRRGRNRVEEEEPEPDLGSPSGVLV